MNVKSKRCKTCNRNKPLRLFYKRKGNKDGHSGSCKSCINKNGNHTNHDRHVQERYGITHTEYEKQLAKQGYACYICRGGTAKRYFAVDHDHKTGEPRGLLCATCNNVLGKFRDNPARFRRAARYLEVIPFRKVLGERDWRPYADENNSKKSPIRRNGR